VIPLLMYWHELDFSIFFNRYIVGAVTSQ